MAIKLGNTNINVFGNNWIKAYLGNTLVLGGAVTQYFLDLDSTQEDYASITNAELNTDVPSSGDWAFGGRITVPIVNPPSVAGLFGRTRGASTTLRYGFWLTNIGGLLVQGYNNENLTIPNFISTYGGQTIDLKAQYEGLDIVFYVDNVEIDRGTLTGRPTDESGATTKYFIGAFGASNGLGPASNAYFNGQIHSFFIGDNEWEVNEGSGSFTTSKVGGYTANLFTISLDPNYFNDFMWQPLI